MEKDTKEETVDQPIEDLQDDLMDDDNDYDDYIIGKSLGNMKDDPASKRSRPRNLPVSKLTATDEDKIPKMPEKILPEPNEKELNLKLKELEEKITAKQKSIDEIKKKKRDKLDELTGINTEQKNERSAIDKALKDLRDLRNAKEKEYENILKQSREASDELKTYEKLGLGTSEKKILAEIKQIQEHLSFEDISVPEEKRLNDRKYDLENYLKVVRRCQPIREAAREPLKEINKIKSDIKAAIAKRDAFYKKYNIVVPKPGEKFQKEEKKEKKSDNPEVNQLNFQIDALIAEKRQLIEEKRKIEGEFNDQYYEWKNQQGLIDYIKRATEKIKQLKQQEKRKLKEKEKKAKNPDENEADKIDTLVKNDKVSLSDPELEKQYKEVEAQLRKAEYLEEYFNSMMGKEETKKEETGETFEREKTKMDDDLAKGKLKKFERDETFGFELGLKDSEPAGGKKKKGKKPKKSARYKEAENLLALDVNILEKFNAIGLTPPPTKENIPKFMEQLKVKKEELVGKKDALLQGNAPVPEEKKEGTEEVAKEEGLKTLADVI